MILRRTATGAGAFQAPRSDENKAISAVARAIARAFVFPVPVRTRVVVFGLYGFFATFSSEFPRERGDPLVG